MNVVSDPLVIRGADARTLLVACAAEVRSGRLVPWLGPEAAALSGATVPAGPEALSAFLEAKVPPPRRAKGNLWQVAQFIESRKHRQTLDALLKEAFATPVPPHALHRWIAEAGPAMIVSAWYDGAMRAALAASGRTDWAEVQGAPRAEIGEARWVRWYGPDGTPVDPALGRAAKTLLYAPHGAVAPAANFLCADSDYVEVLTEIDIQTPIPEEVRTRRTARGFLFLGCRFHDQMLRTYARQVVKRSVGRHVAVGDASVLTKNERRFLVEQGIALVDLPLASAVEILSAG